MSPSKRDGLRIDGAKRRWRAPDEKKEREAKKRIISALTKGQKVWVFNSKEQWPLNSVSVLLRAFFLRRQDFLFFTRYRKSVLWLPMDRGPYMHTRIHDRRRARVRAMKRTLAHTRRGSTRPCA